MRGLFEPWHLLIVLLVILVLFGGKKLPEAARGLGRSMRIFKSEVKEMRDEDKAHDASAGTGPLEGRVVGEGRVPTSPAGSASEPEPVRAPEPVREPEPVRSPDERRPGL